MKNASATLISLLNSSTQFYMADLYTFTLNDGTILRYTSADIDLTVAGNTFTSKELLFERGQVRLIRGVEVDTLSVDIFFKSTDLVSSLPFVQVLINGGIDGARVKLERIFMPTWGDTSAGTIVIFSGRVSESSFDRTYASLSIKSDLELLNIQMPKNLYQPSCSHTLYDTGCGVNKATYSTNATIAAGSTTTLLNTTLSRTDDFYTQGIIYFTSGANTGVKRTIKLYNSGQITLSLALPHVPSAGDTFTASAGCDKTKNTCTNKFNNLANFRGFPFIPTPETAR